MRNDGIEVDLDQLYHAAAMLANLREYTLDPTGPLRPGAFRDLDDAGALGPVHDAERAAAFDRALRQGLAGLEALFGEHTAMLGKATEAIFNCLTRYTDVEQALKERFEAVAANGYLPYVYPTYVPAQNDASAVTL